MNVDSNPKTPSTKFVILFIGRSGSTYLASAVDAHSQTKVGFEPFAGDKLKTADAQDRWLNNYYSNHAAASYRAVGFKTKYIDLADKERFANELRSNDARIIHLSRRNTVKQVVSWFNGERLFQKTERWNLFDGSDKITTALSVDPHEFQSRLKMIDKGHVRMANYVDAGATPSQVFEDYVTADSLYFNYYNIVEKWAGVFGKQNMTIRIFEKEKFVNGNLSDDFIHSTGIVGYEDFIVPQRLNEGLSSQAQKTLNLFNNCFPRFVDNKPSKSNNELRKKIIDELERKYQGRESLPNREEAMTFYEQFAPSNRDLSREYLSTENLFSTDFSDYPIVAEREPLRDIVVSDIFRIISEHGGNTVVHPKHNVSTINLNNDRGAILRDLALTYVKDYPEIALFLMTEARKYRPNGPFIADKIDQLTKRVEGSNTSADGSDN